jgi:4-amino-4-deoxy-L-arabinose transferase-like glycosyltransferase
VKKGEFPSFGSTSTRCLRFGWLVALFALLWWTAPDIGVTRDEGYYFKAAQQYWAWVEGLFSSGFQSSFSDAMILRHFDYNHEHPPLVKIVQGAMHAFFSRLLGLTDSIQGFRVAGFGFAVLAGWVTMRLGDELAGRPVGLIAGMSLFVIPRLFFHAHLAAFDVPVAAMWTLGLWAFHRTLDADRAKRPKIWTVAIVFGLGLATKLNVFFLPMVFLPVWVVWGLRNGFFRTHTDAVGHSVLRLPPLPWVLVLGGLLAPLVFYLTWPYLWHDPWPRFLGYLQFHLHHEHYPISYFHRLLVRPPFPVSFPFVMTLLTVPGPILVLGIFGFLVSCGRIARERSEGDALLVFGLLLPIVVIALPNTPIFGGVKHWLNAMPALTILAARTLVDVVRNARHWLADSRYQKLATAFALILYFGPGLLGTAAIHPNGLAFYNELAGGVRGGAALGMQRGYWGGLARPLYERFRSDRTPVQVFFNRTNYDAYQAYRKDGVLGPGVRYASSPRGADFSVHFEQPEHGEAEAETRTYLGPRPIDGVYFDEVTLVQLYQKGDSRRAPVRPPTRASPDVAEAQE